MAPHPYSIVRSEAVNDLDSAEQFIKQQVGVGYVTGNDRAIFRKKVNELFEQYPQASWQTLARTAEWAKSRRRRYSRLFQVVEAVRYAYEDGYLPELDPNTTVDVDGQIQDALRFEEDPQWRRRLLVAQGLQAKTAVLDMWQQLRAEREFA